MCECMVVCNKLASHSGWITQCSWDSFSWSWHKSKNLLHVVIWKNVHNKKHKFRSYAITDISSHCVILPLWITLAEQPPRLIFLSTHTTNNSKYVFIICSKIRHIAVMNADKKGMCITRICTEVLVITPFAFLSLLCTADTLSVDH